MRVAPADRSGSACRMERKVSLPSKPSPAKKAPITGMTDSSSPSQATRPSRYCSRKHLHTQSTHSMTGSLDLAHRHVQWPFTWSRPAYEPPSKTNRNGTVGWLRQLTVDSPVLGTWEQLAQRHPTEPSIGKAPWFAELPANHCFWSQILWSIYSWRLS